MFIIRKTRKRDKNEYDLEPTPVFSPTLSTFEASTAENFNTTTRNNFYTTTSNLEGNLALGFFILCYIFYFDLKTFGLTIYGFNF
jgi:hypothetical protein